MIRIFLAGFMSLAVCLFLHAPAHADSRIVGGSEASIKRWPFLVAVVLRADPDPVRGLICGGSLLAPRKVLTAAHCVRGSSAADFDIVFRRSNLRSDRGSRVRVTALEVHPDYNPQTEARDLALLRLARPLPGPYPRRSRFVAADEKLEVAGWGWRRGIYPSRLRSSSVVRNSKEECLDIFSFSLLVQSMFCATGDGGEACTKDSGGPLLDRRNFSLQGVVSWGYAGCGNAPTVYALLDTGWIRRAF